MLLPASASADPAELRYFYRAPWPSSEIYANWLIDEWNKTNGDRIHVTGAAVDGETYKTKQAIELASSNPPDIFYSWEGGRAAEIIANGFALAARWDRWCRIASFTELDGTAAKR